MILLYIMKWCEFLVCLWFAEQGGLVCGRVGLALVDGDVHGFDAGCFFLPLGGVVGVLLHYEGGIAKLPLEGGYLLLGRAELGGQYRLRIILLEVVDRAVVLGGHFLTFQCRHLIS